ncbi:hypothetical protein EJ08DRAFT_647511 [Tothia fuscella]|uniref:Uncharacterized protein n=1 Tax=Tothia fuscella TaxID=1048955 RepID=A0A9P4U0U3_9PEZI|nr:hypothetical protein EJ08DRAFT_647511 [Tothia fuscella]
MYPDTIISSSCYSPVSAASQLLTKSSISFQAMSSLASMAPFSNNGTSPANRGIHPSYQNYVSQQQAAAERSSPTASEISPLSPTYTLHSPPIEHVRRREVRSNANLLHHRWETLDSHARTEVTYLAYTPGTHAEATPRSAPSLITTFPPERPRSSVTPGTRWPMPSPSTTRFNQYHSYSSPATTFSPIGNNSNESWEASPQRSRSQSYMTSPTSYAPPWLDSAPEVHQEGSRGYSAWSAPEVMQSPQPAQSSDRRESEAMGGFTSPSEFALFAEATSSLNIVAIKSSPWSRGVRPSSRPLPTQSRLEAPLPPIPRSHSSPAPDTRSIGRQRSQSQLLTEALVGWDQDEGHQGSEISDDELPDYAQSQAEAHAHQRREAARRAQELEQRWSSARRRW